MEIQNNRPSEYGGFGLNHPNVADIYLQSPDNNNDNEIKIDGMDMNNYEYDGGDIWAIAFKLNSDFYNKFIQTTTLLLEFIASHSVSIT